ncbi:hypothetical protein F383_26685 [Gossypium arboreum]|uniref:Uncharacterized protein n=1 Tax=Gossypium arboreum TaxID=29729 RepID=A0A0B0PC12_GOSAR|nr:hypothetical protein F383_26685 [Gossypium arboreum]
MSNPIERLICFLSSPIEKMPYRDIDVTNWSQK